MKKIVIFINPGADGALLWRQIEMDLREWKVGASAPVWIPDDRVSMCMLCQHEFRLVFRRHHCRGCGKVSPAPHSIFLPVL